MEKLTLNELLPYAPYGVMVTKDNWDNILRMVVERYELDTYDININVVLELEAKLILRPFRSFVTFTEILEEMTDDEVELFKDGTYDARNLSYFVLDKMFKNHIDVFNLIPRGLAVNYNTLENGTEDNSDQGEHNQTPDREGTGNGWEIHDGHTR
jgi:hypothetical protein